MDALRAAVGDDRLTYAGYSYGTYLGATYANLFPRRIRALVLDGVVDPTRYQRREPGPLGINAFLRAGADVDADATLGQFLRLCGSAPARCAFGAGHDPRARFTALAQRLRRSPIQVPDGAGGTVRVGFGDLVNVTLTLLYAQDVWPVLADALAGLDGGDPTLFVRLLKQLTADPLLEGQWASLCSEAQAPHHLGAWPVAARAAERRAPVFGRYWAYGTQPCASWRRLDADRYDGPWDRRTSAPILLVNPVYDPATPYRAAVAANRILPGSRLLTVRAYGHTAFLQPSTCAQRVVQEYLIDGVLPPRGAVCSADRAPFA